MFKDELKQIKEMLEANEPFKTSSFIYNPWGTSHNEYEGIPDPMQYKTFAHVRQEAGKTPWRPTKEDCRYLIQGSFVIVAGISCLNARKAIKSLSNQLLKTVMPNEVIIKDTEDNEFLIYKEETKDFLTGAAGKNLQDKNLKLIRIRFDLRKNESINSCEVLTCEDCC